MVTTSAAFNAMGTALRVGPYQAPSAQKDTAKVSRNYHAYIHNPLGFEHLHDGQACGATWFSVVAVTHDAGI